MTLTKCEYERMKLNWDYVGVTWGGLEVGGVSYGALGKRRVSSNGLEREGAGKREEQSRNETEAVEDVDRSPSALALYPFSFTGIEVGNVAIKYSIWGRSLEILVRQSALNFALASPALAEAVLCYNRSLELTAVLGPSTPTPFKSSTGDTSSEVSGTTFDRVKRSLALLPFLLFHPRLSLQIGLQSIKQLLSRLRKVLISYLLRVAVFCFSFIVSQATLTLEDVHFNLVGDGPHSGALFECGEAPQSSWPQTGMTPGKERLSVTCSSLKIWAHIPRELPTLNGFGAHCAIECGVLALECKGRPRRFPSHEVHDLQTEESGLVCVPRADFLKSLSVTILPNRCRRRAADVRVTLDFAIFRLPATESQSRCILLNFVEAFDDRLRHLNVVRKHKIRNFYYGCGSPALLSPRDRLRSAVGRIIAKKHKVAMRPYRSPIAAAKVQTWLCSHLLPENALLLRGLASARGVEALKRFTSSLGSVTELPARLQTQNLPRAVLEAALCLPARHIQQIYNAIDSEGNALDLQFFDCGAFPSSKAQYEVNLQIKLINDLRISAEMQMPEKAGLKGSNTLHFPRNSIHIDEVSEAPERAEGGEGDEGAGGDDNDVVVEASLKAEDVHASLVLSPDLSIAGFDLHLPEVVVAVEASKFLLRLESYINEPSFHYGLPSAPLSSASADALSQPQESSVIRFGSEDWRTSVGIGETEALAAFLAALRRLAPASRRAFVPSSDYLACQARVNTVLPFSTPASAQSSKANACSVTCLELHHKGVEVSVDLTLNLSKESPGLAHGSGSGNVLGTRKLSSARFLSALTASFNLFEGSAPTPAHICIPQALVSFAVSDEDRASSRAFDDFEHVHFSSLSEAVDAMSFVPPFAPEDSATASFSDLSRNFIFLDDFHFKPAASRSFGNVNGSAGDMGEKEAEELEGDEAKDVNGDAEEAAEGIGLRVNALEISVAYRMLVHLVMFANTCNEIVNKVWDTARVAKQRVRNSSSTRRNIIRPSTRVVSPHRGTSPPAQELLMPQRLPFQIGIFGIRVLHIPVPPSARYFSESFHHESYRSPQFVLRNICGSVDELSSGSRASAACSVGGLGLWTAAFRPDGTPAWLQILDPRPYQMSPTQPPECQFDDSPADPSKSSSCHKSSKCVSIHFRGAEMPATLEVTLLEGISILWEMSLFTALRTFADALNNEVSTSKIAAAFVVASELDAGPVSGTSQTLAQYVEEVLAEPIKPSAVADTTFIVSAQVKQYLHFWVAEGTRPGSFHSAYSASVSVLFRADGCLSIEVAIDGLHCYYLSDEGCSLILKPMALEHQITRREADEEAEKRTASDEPAWQGLRLKVDPTAGYVTSYLDYLPRVSIVMCPIEIHVVLYEALEVLMGFLRKVIRVLTLVADMKVRNVNRDQVSCWAKVLLNSAEFKHTLNFLPPLSRIKVCASLHLLTDPLLELTADEFGQQLIANLVLCVKHLLEAPQSQPEEGQSSFELAHQDQPTAVAIAVEASSTLFESLPPESRDVQLEESSDTPEAPPMSEALGLIASLTLLAKTLLDVRVEGARIAVPVCPAVTEGDDDNEPTPESLEQFVISVVDGIHVTNGTGIRPLSASDAIPEGLMEKTGDGGGRLSPQLRKLWRDSVQFSPELLAWSESSTGGDLLLDFEQIKGATYHDYYHISLKNASVSLESKDAEELATTPTGLTPTELRLTPAGTSGEVFLEGQKHEFLFEGADIALSLNTLATQFGRSLVAPMLLDLTLSPRHPRTGLNTADLSAPAGPLELCVSERLLTNLLQLIFFHILAVPRPPDPRQETVRHRSMAMDSTQVLGGSREHLTHRQSLERLTSIREPEEKQKLNRGRLQATTTATDLGAFSEDQDVKDAEERTVDDEEASVHSLDLRESPVDRESAHTPSHSQLIDLLHRLDIAVYIVLKDAQISISMGEKGHADQSLSADELVRASKRVPDEHEEVEIVRSERIEAMCSIYTTGELLLDVNLKPLHFSTPSDFDCTAPQLRLLYAQGASTNTSNYINSTVPGFAHTRYDSTFPAAVRTQLFSPSVTGLPAETLPSWSFISLTPEEVQVSSSVKGILPLYTRTLPGILGAFAASKIRPRAPSASASSSTPSVEAYNPSFTGNATTSPMNAFEDKVEGIDEDTEATSMPTKRVVLFSMPHPFASFCHDDFILSLRPAATITLGLYNEALAPLPSECETTLTLEEGCSMLLEKGGRSFPLSAPGSELRFRTRTSNPKGSAIHVNVTSPLTVAIFRDHLALVFDLVDTLSTLAPSTHGLSPVALEKKEQGTLTGPRETTATADPQVHSFAISMQKICILAELPNPRAILYSVNECDATTTPNSLLRDSKVRRTTSQFIAVKAQEIRGSLHTHTAERFDFGFLSSTSASAGGLDFSVSHVDLSQWIPSRFCYHNFLSVSSLFAELVRDKRVDCSEDMKTTAKVKFGERVALDANEELVSMLASASAVYGSCLRAEGNSLQIFRQWSALTTRGDVPSAIAGSGVEICEAVLANESLEKVSAQFGWQSLQEWVRKDALTFAVEVTADEAEAVELQIPGESRATALLLKEGGSNRTSVRLDKRGLLRCLLEERSDVECGAYISVGSFGTFFFSLSAASPRGPDQSIFLGVDREGQNVFIKSESIAPTQLSGDCFDTLLLLTVATSHWKVHSLLPSFPLVEGSEALNRALLQCHRTTPRRAGDSQGESSSHSSGSAALHERSGSQRECDEYVVVWDSENIEYKGHEGVDMQTVEKNDNGDTQKESSNRQLACRMMKRTKWKGIIGPRTHELSSAIMSTYLRRAISEPPALLLTPPTFAQNLSPFEAVLFVLDPRTEELLTFTLPAISRKRYIYDALFATYSSLEVGLKFPALGLQGGFRWQSDVLCCPMDEKLSKYSESSSTGCEGHSNQNKLHSFEVERFPRSFTVRLYAVLTTHETSTEELGAKSSDISASFSPGKDSADGSVAEELADTRLTPRPVPRQTVQVAEHSITCSFNSERQAGCLGLQILPPTLVLRAQKESMAVVQKALPIANLAGAVEVSDHGYESFQVLDRLPSGIRLQTSTPLSSWHSFSEGSENSIEELEDVSGLKVAVAATCVIFRVTNCTNEPLYISLVPRQGFALHGSDGVRGFDDAQAQAEKIESGATADVGGEVLWFSSEDFRVAGGLPAFVCLASWLRGPDNAKGSEPNDGALKVPLDIAEQTVTSHAKTGQPRHYLVARSFQNLQLCLTISRIDGPFKRRALALPRDCLCAIAMNADGMSDITKATQPLPSLPVALRPPSAATAFALAPVTLPPDLTRWTVSRAVSPSHTGSEGRHRSVCGTFSLIKDSLHFFAEDDIQTQHEEQAEVRGRELRVGQSPFGSRSPSKKRKKDAGRVVEFEFVQDGDDEELTQIFYGDAIKGSHAPNAVCENGSGNSQGNESGAGRMAGHQEGCQGATTASLLIGDLKAPDVCLSCELPDASVALSAGGSNVVICLHDFSVEGYQKTAEDLPSTSDAEVQERSLERSYGLNLRLRHLSLFLPPDLNPLGPPIFPDFLSIRPRPQNDDARTAAEGEGKLGRPASDEQANHREYGGKRASESPYQKRTKDDSAALQLQVILQCHQQRHLFRTPQNESARSTSIFLTRFFDAGLGPISLSADLRSLDGLLACLEGLSSCVTQHPQITHTWLPSTAKLKGQNETSVSPSHASWLVLAPSLEGTPSEAGHLQLNSLTVDWIPTLLDSHCARSALMRGVLHPAANSERHFGMDSPVSATSSLELESPTMKSRAAAFAMRSLPLLGSLKGFKVDLGNRVSIKPQSLATYDALLNEILAACRPSLLPLALRFIAHLDAMGQPSQVFDALRESIERPGSFKGMSRQIASSFVRSFSLFGLHLAQLASTVDGDSAAQQSALRAALAKHPRPHDSPGQRGPPRSPPRSPSRGALLAAKERVVSGLQTLGEAGLETAAKIHTNGQANTQSSSTAREPLPSMRNMYPFLQALIAAEQVARLSRLPRSRFGHEVEELDEIFKCAYGKGIPLSLLQSIPQKLKAKSRSFVFHRCLLAVLPNELFLVSSSLRCRADLSRRQGCISCSIGERS